MAGHRRAAAPRALTTIDWTATMARDPAMITIRSIAPDELDAWLTLSGTVPPDDRLARRMRAAWQDATGGSTLTFVAERDGRAVGRLAYVNTPAASVLPGVLETSMVGLWLPWEAGDAVDVGRRLIVETLEALPDGVHAVDGYANPEYMPRADVRRAVFEAAGMPLFQEKEGFLWQSSNPDPPLQRTPRLHFTSAEEVGEEPFARVMARAVVGTLDRQDGYYRELVGPEGWGQEMLGYLGDDASSWLIALEEDGTEVGYVLVGAFDEPGRATLSHIGVVPESRGRGYVDELLQAGNAAARRRGFDRILSDVDVDNPPMLAAMERNGHSAAATTWHVWHHRLERSAAARPAQTNPAKYPPGGS
jgi:GNAT superfamily N-acetyltransferase